MLLNIYQAQNHSAYFLNYCQMSAEKYFILKSYSTFSMTISFLNICFFTQFSRYVVITAYLVKSINLPFLNLYAFSDCGDVFQRTKNQKTGWSIYGSCTVC